MPSPFNIRSSAFDVRRSPFLKSYTLWLGLLSLIALLWAWQDSRAHWSDAGVGSAGSNWTIGQSGERIYLWHDYRPGGGAAPFRKSATRMTRQKSFERFAYGHAPPPPVKFKKGSLPGGVGNACWSVAWWLVIILHLALWSCLLYYRQRRISKAAAELAAIAPTD